LETADGAHQSTPGDGVNVTLGTADGAHQSTPADGVNVTLETADGAHQSTPADGVNVTLETALGQVIGITIGAVDNFLGIQYGVSFLAWVISSSVSRQR
jgi:hypothetical protein